MTVNFRLAGPDAKRTAALEDYLFGETPRTFREEIAGTQSIIWRAVYRAGLTALEELRAAGAPPPQDEDPPTPKAGEMIKHPAATGAEAKVSQHPAAGGITSNSKQLLEEVASDSAVEKGRQERGKARKKKNEAKGKP